MKWWRWRWWQYVQHFTSAWEYPNKTHTRTHSLTFSMKLYLHVSFQYIESESIDLQIAFVFLKFQTIIMSLSSLRHWLDANYHRIINGNLEAIGQLNIEDITVRIRDTHNTMAHFMQHKTIYDYHLHLGDDCVIMDWIENTFIIAAKIGIEMKINCKQTNYIKIYTEHCIQIKHTFIFNWMDNRRQCLSTASSIFWLFENKCRQ